MNPFARWLERCRVDREMADEIATHLAEKIDQLREDGHSEADARAIALRQFGNTTLQKENSREAWGWNTMEQILQDIRFGWRVLRKAPGFTLTAIIVLALGIGMNTAMFSAVKAVLLAALPYPEPERMVELQQTAKDGHAMNVSGPDFRDWRAQSHTIESMATWDADEVVVSGDFSPHRVRMGAVGAGFFNVAATNAAIGRAFSPGEQKPGGPATIVLSHQLAQTIFGVAGNSIQKVMHLNGMAFTVIGVMPPGFNFPERAQLWIPNDLFPDESDRSAHNYHVVGRLKSGVTLAQARAEMNVIAARLANQYPTDKDQGIRVSSLYDYLTSSVKPTLLVLMGAVSLVLLIACVNISNLQLARATARAKEIGMRYALGARRSRLVRQLLTESILLAGIGGFAGIALAKILVRTLRAFAPANIPRIENLHMDMGVLAFTACASLFAGLLFGVIPAFQASRTDVNEALKVTRHHFSGQTLVVGQVALAIVLLSSAALLMKSYWKLSHVETGLASGGVFLTDVTWPASADGNSVEAPFVKQVGNQIIQQIDALPGVTASAMINGLPFDGAPNGGFEIEGRPVPSDPHMVPYATYRMATPDYFRIVGLPLLKGRGFAPEDERSSQQVAIVNQSFEKRFFPNADSVGRRIRFFGFDRKPQFMTIVGVVPDVRSNLKDASDADVYANYFQHADTRMDAMLLVRGPASLQPRIEQIIRGLHRNTVVEFQSMDGLIAGTIARERFQTSLLGVFASCALLLAVVGLYGLLSYMVTRRTSELGLRMALGASRAGIIRFILAHGGRLVLIGVVVGLIGALIVNRLLQAMLFQVSTADPAALLAVIFGFVLAALAGSFMPAQRASRIDPAVALRTE